MSCQQKLNGSPVFNCPNTPTHYFTWPGREELHVCETHASWAHKVAEVLGFDLHITTEPKVQACVCLFGATFCPVHGKRS